MTTTATLTLDQIVRDSSPHPKVVSRRRALACIIAERGGTIPRLWQLEEKMKERGHRCHYTTIHRDLQQMGLLNSQ